MSKFRHIVEMSSMSNNDEYIYYTESPEFDIKDVKTKMFDSPRVVMSREVQQIELDNGLRLEYHSIWHEPPIKDPDVTYYLDSYERMKSKIQFCKKFFQHKTPEAILDYIIGGDFYDCMSGGMPKYSMAICYLLCKTEGINLDTEVYPKDLDKGTYYTLKSFVEEIEEHHTDIVQFCQSMIKSLPSAQLLLT